MDTTEVPTNLRASFHQTEHGWGVKLQGNIGQATGHAGKRVQVTKRNNTHKTVTLGGQLLQWNAGRSAVYAIGRQ